MNSFVAQGQRAWFHRMSNDVNVSLLCLVPEDQEDHSEASQPAAASDDESGTETQVMHHCHTG